MKRIWDKWTGVSLVIRILAGIIIGGALALLLPDITAPDMLGTIFVGVLKAIAPILVFVLVISALCNAQRVQGGVIRTVIVLYLVSTVIAAVISVFASRAWPVAVNLDGIGEAVELVPPSGVGEAIINILMNIVQNPVSALANANYIGILFWAVLIGIVLKKASDGFKRAMRDIADAISTIVKGIIEFAPFGIMGLVASAVRTGGLNIFTDYGKLLLVLAGCMFTMMLAVNPFIVFLCIRKNPYPLVFRCLRASGVTAFFTRSSAANIPINMKACEEFGLDKNTYSVTIPLGATINMDGAAITITTLTMTACYTMGIMVDIPSAIVLSLLATAAACGSSGVAGGSLLLVPTACSLFGIPESISMQMVAVGFIIGVINDSIETALNSSSDLLFTAAGEQRQKRIEETAGHEKPPNG